MKLYQIVVQFTEPAQAVVTIGADSEEEAISKLTKELEEQVQDVQVISCAELGELNQDLTPETPIANLPDNVIAFPGTNTKH